MKLKRLRFIVRFAFFSGRQILTQIVFYGTFCSFHKTLSRFTFPKQQNGIGYGTYYSCDYILSHVFSLVFVAFAILALLFLCIWSIIFNDLFLQNLQSKYLAFAKVDILYS